MSGDGKFSEERVRQGTVQKEMLHTVQRKQVVDSGYGVENGDELFP